MKRAFSLLLAVYSLASPVLQAQTMSHEEEAVRNSYAKLSYVCELVAISPAAFYIKGNGQYGPRRSDLALLVAITTPTFILSDFKTGAVADIANEKWSGFITGRPIDYLAGSSRNYSYNYWGNITQWNAIEMKWAQNKTPYTPTGEYLKMTVADAIKTQQAMWVNQGSGFSRYATYTVNATFQGKSTGPYRAIAFFGIDSHGKEVLAPTDMVTDSGLLFNILALPAYPGAFLSSDIRTVPVVAAWVRSHEIAASSCGSAAKDEVCCSNGRCGISEADLNRELSAPLPSRKTSGGTR